MALAGFAQVQSVTEHTLTHTRNPWKELTLQTLSSLSYISPQQIPAASPYRRTDRGVGGSGQLTDEGEGCFRGRVWVG